MLIPLTLRPAAEADLLILMITAIGKWLAALVQVQGPSRVRLASTLGYKIDQHAAHEDLISFALRFDPVIAPPPNPLSPSAPPPEDECRIALAILESSARRRDVDAFLEQRPDLHEEMVGETERLLTEARYEVATYRQWLAL